MEQETNTGKEFTGYHYTLAAPVNTVPDTDYSEGDPTYPETFVRKVMERVEQDMERAFPGITVTTSMNSNDGFGHRVESSGRPLDDTKREEIEHEADRS